MTTSSPYVREDVLSELSLKDVQNFLLSYLENEYSPRSTASRLVGAMPSSVRPAYERRWIDIGQAALPAAERMGPIGMHGEPDTHKLMDILSDQRLPASAILQFVVVAQDFGIKHRFSRVWTKLDRTVQWDALADRLLNDQSIIHGLFSPKSEGFLMASHSAEVARTNIQAVAKTKFLFIKGRDNFQVNIQTLLRQRVPFRSTFAQHLIHQSSSLAFRLPKAKARPCWVHHRRELIYLEDVQDAAPDEAFVRNIRWNNQCDDCGCGHNWNLMVAIAPYDALADDAALPPPYHINAN